MARRASNKNPVDGGGADDPVFLARLIDDAVALYRARFPEDWGVCQNWPVQHALAHIAAKLRSLG